MPSSIHNRRPHRLLGCLLGALILSSATTESSFGQAVTTAFTYQGVLKNAGTPLNGTVDLRFTLWDAAAGGNQIGVALAVNAASLTDGLITTSLDFGVSAFGGSQRFLQIEVDTTPGGGVGPFVTLTPRQPLTAVPYAMFALAGSGQWTPNGTALNYTQGNVSIGTSTQNGRVTIYPATGGGTQTGLYVRNTDGANQYSVSNFIADSAAGIGVQASVASGNSTGRAISAVSGASLGMGVYAQNSATTGTNYGVYGRADSTAGIGVYGLASAASGTTYAIFGQSNSAAGWAGYFAGRGYFSNSLLVGRTNTIGAEVFGIGEATSGFSGMYASTNADGEPFYGYSAGGDIDAYHYYNSIDDTWRLYMGGTRLAVSGTTGNVGIGTASPEYKLQIEGGTDSEPASGGFLVTGPTTGLNISIDNNEIMARNNGVAATLSLNNDGGNVSVCAGGGMLITPVLQITGGADLSEQFEVSDANIEPTPGMVVVIDPANPGHLMPATSAYDKKVAGVISGAGGVATGMMMGHQGTIADGAHAVALTGRVYCLVDATDAAIEPGDMLTTSATAGHAMKASDEVRSHGAIIGKAMTALPRGEKGLVLVLVNLQ